MELTDVAVLGGGPAGLAVATALAARGRSVVVLEREPRAASKTGETFGPRLRPLLEELGAWDSFVALATVPFRGVRSAWGTSELRDRPSLVHPLGEGWHVDRARFEEMLAAVAVRAGAGVRRGAGACHPAGGEAGGWRVVAQDGQEVARARYLVDASGRGAPATARLVRGRAWISFDRQIGIVLRGALAGPPLEPELLLESSEHGWWYSVPQPGGTLLCVLLTDADVAPAGPREGLAERVHEALARTVHTARLAASASFAPPTVVRADTGFLCPDRGPGWCAVGDAAMGGDPLAGDGIERALSGALRAAAAIERELDGAPPEPLPPAAPRIEAYLSARARHYALERRWTSSLFWRRRQPIDPHREPIVLSPVEELRLGPRPPHPEALARPEALAPRKVLAAAFEALRAPRPAHAVLSEMRRAAPIDDRRLLIALQLLVEDGFVERSPPLK